MKTYCVSCRKNTANKNSCVKRTKKKKKNRIMLVSNCAVWGKVKSLYVKN